MQKIITILSLILFVSLIHSQTSDPILRLNTEMHTAKSGRISSDAKGQYILTVSRDKTAKLWDAASGDMIKTFRPPIDEGNKGMLYAGALSPDGRLAAVGGWSYFDNKTNDIYLFNTSTGDIVQHLSGFGNVIHDLEFSNDGTYLAASLGSGKGLKIFKKSGYNRYDEYKTLSGYKERSYSIAFDKDDRLATVAYDGFIRLYDTHFNLVKQTGGAGRQPFTIAFSPQGNKIAIGYSDVPQVEVRSGSDLGLLYRPRLNGMDKEGGLNKVSFSADGRYLYGGGSYSKKIDGKWWRVIRRWENAGNGSFTDYPACGNTVMDIKPLPDGDMIYSGVKPDFGRLSPSGNKRFYKAAEINSYSAKDRSHFKINNRGDEIEFKPLNKPALNFSLGERKLKVSERNDHLEEYSDNRSGVSVSDWKNTDVPKINGRLISFFKKYEKCRSADISAVGRMVVLGTEWTIYCAYQDGTKIWETNVQGVAWTVNISGNGKVVASAQSGGVINWYRMDDGQLLLTFYAHPETRQWVVFTPGGYYDASPGAEKFIGWHLNNGPDNAAYFFPASKFRNKYYRPDVIDNVLITADEDEALRIADLAANRRENTTQISNMLPPVVNIIKPAYNQTVSDEQLTMEYTVNSPDNEPITNVRFMIDGRPVDHQRGFKKVAANGLQSKTITIPKRDVTIQVLAENRHGWSTPAQVKVKWQGIKTEDILKPTLYVLSIGVSDYQNDQFDLKYAAKDALDFAATMKKQKGKLYKDVVVRTLTNERARKPDILDGLDWIQKETTARDIAMIFIAGHGVNDNVGSFHYLPHEADLDRMRRTALLFTELKYTASAMPGKLVMFVDACHSGDVMGGRRAPDVNLLVNELSDVESGAVVFTSSTGKQFSLENEAWGNGAFTKALIEGMNGKADLFRKGQITIKTLDAYIAERVKALTSGNQSPTVVIPESMPDFPIGVVQ